MKNNKFIKYIYLVIGLILGVTVFVSAGTYNSSEITYDNSTSGSTKTNVKDAVDELYEKSKIPKRPICIRAYTLHTQGEKTFGLLGTNGTLASGDAFDCDVNGDGRYNAETERFYYVTDLTSDSNKAVLIYYSNTSSGVADPTKMIAYNEANVNNLGPVTAVSDLPSTSQWVTTITKPRQITNENGGTTTYTDNIASFDYGDRAARLLTAQEVITACNRTANAFCNARNLDECTYLMENTSYADTSLPAGYWLETPSSSSSYPNYAWIVRDANFCGSIAGKANYVGARPVIEVPKSEISY